MPRPNRRPLIPLLGFLLLFPHLGPGRVVFVHVWPRWYNLAYFQRISEYFTGRENPGSWTIVRTQPEVRPGFYFVVRVKNRGPLIRGTHFAISVILPGHPDPRTYDFPADVPAKGKVFQLGLTGSDWPGEKIYPLAWKVDLLASDGSVLTTEQSFLWSKPN